MGNLIAREHDWKMLEQRLKSAKSTHEREQIKDKMAQIKRESEDPEIERLRFQLVNAAKSGDNEAGDSISEQIYLHQLKIGKIREK